MTNQEIARQRFAAYDAANSAIGWRKDYALDAAHGYQHGWIVVNGESFNKDKAFPEIRFPRFPADQGLSD